MNKKEFLKSHPSLKGKKCWLYEGYEASWIMEEGDEAGLDSVTNQDEIYYKEEDIQKTQLDEQKVKEAIDKAYKPQENWGDHDLWKYMDDLKKELRL